MLTKSNGTTAFSLLMLAFMYLSVIKTVSMKESEFYTKVSIYVNSIVEALCIIRLRSNLLILL